MRKSVNYGASWANSGGCQQPTDGSVRPADVVDRLLVGGACLQIERLSNGFRDMTTGQVFVAWQERTESNGSPRIVLTRSDDYGKNWTSRQVVDNDPLLKPYNAGAGGHVAKQSIARATGDAEAQLRRRPPDARLLRIARPDQFSDRSGRPPHDGRRDFVAYSDLTGPSPGFITGYDRVVDFRAAAARILRGWTPAL